MIGTEIQDEIITRISDVEIDKEKMQDILNIIEEIPSEDTIS